MHFDRLFGLLFRAVCCRIPRSFLACVEASGYQNRTAQAEPVAPEWVTMVSQSLVSPECCSIESSRKG